MAVKNTVITPDDIFNQGVKTLNEKMEGFQKQVDLELSSIKSNLNSEISSMKKYLGETSRSLKENLEDRQNDLNIKIKENISLLNDIKRDIINTVNSYDKEHTERDTQIYNIIESQNKKINNLNVSFIDKPEGDYIYFTDKEGKIKTTFIAKPYDKYIPDENTLTYKNGRVSLKNSFNSKDFKIINDEVNVTGFLLDGGKHLSADKINNDLNNATYNISNITSKLESVIKKLNTINGYITSNNFKKASPSQDSLTDFTLKCISSATDKELTSNLIPSGTKIKNLFDNHIWVFNRVSIDGLITTKWEDFGSDNICLANNSGVHGLVTGSQDKYRGYIDLKGVISINGLEEELSSISNQISQIAKDLNSCKTKINTLEARVSLLEKE